MPISDPCAVCNKSVNKNQYAVLCDMCGYWVHIKCNNITKNEYAILEDSDQAWACTVCENSTIPFSDISNEALLENATTLPPDTHSFTKVPSKSLSATFAKINKSVELSIEYDREDDVDNSLSCKYYNVNEFVDENFNNQKVFSLLHLNVASLSKNFDGLDNMITSLGLNFDIIALTESRIVKDYPISTHTELPNYVIEHTPTESTCGGSLLYISKNLCYKPRPDLLIYKPKLLESIFIEIINANSANTIIGCIYRHPSMVLKEFNDDYLDPLLSQLDKERNKKFYLLGDFNVDLLKIETHEQSSKFLQIMESNNIAPLIMIPTRITARSKSLIDNIFTNQVNSKSISGNLTCTVSDHLPQFHICPIESKTSPQKHNIYRRNWSNFNRESFVQDFSIVDWNATINTELNDANHSFEAFNSKINELIDKHAPKRKLSNKEMRFLSKPWITKGIQTSINKRDTIFRKFKRLQNPILKSTQFDLYKSYRNLIKNLIWRSKKDYLSKYFTEHSNNARKVWQGIRGIINVKNNNRFTPRCINTKDGPITDPALVANNFNNFFSSIGMQIQNKIHSDHTNFQQYLTNPSNVEFIVRPVEPDEVCKLISSFKINKSLGPNSVPQQILSLVKNEISESLTTLINMSFSSGVYPNKLKIAEIIPVHKSGSKLEVNNYRPISLLSNINKIFEKLIYERVYSFLTEQNSFYELQFGFRNKHSTAHALFSLTEQIRKALDNNSFACGIFIDLKKAFDTVDHTILLSKLKHYGISGTANKWLSSYLTDRQQYVTINGFQSDKRSIKIGVPQGSVLGPLLFLIYINDLNKAISFSSVHHFADDTNLLVVDKCPKHLTNRLNADLRQLCNWLKANKISLNVAKTELVIFKHPNKPLDYEMKLKLDGKRLIPTYCTKYLGILIDETLSFKNHIANLIRKLSRANGMLAKIRHFVSPKILKCIYYSIFASHMYYNCVTWGQLGNPKSKQAIFSTELSN